VLQHNNDPTTLISQLTPGKAREMIATGKADRGMIPKLDACLSALQGGVEEVHLINASTQNALLVEVFTDAGIGTMLVSE
jgi:acetylglutamate kinase